MFMANMKMSVLCKYRSGRGKKELLVSIIGFGDDDLKRQTRGRGKDGVKDRIQDVLQLMQWRSQPNLA